MSEKVTAYKEDFEYAAAVLNEQLKKDAGKYVAQKMLERAGEEGDVPSTLFGSMMKDSSVDQNVHALSKVIQVLQSLQASDKVPARPEVES
ncbi:hypothetical protein [Mycolicibacterium sp. PDY-3]|uniref:hypothetical protein n=1 Tax=Mycolicibacterium sp. PDY-3 TaxID=3376069 RepID=UPI0037914A60